MNDDIKTVLLSNFPLPYSGIGSWTNMINFYLKTDNKVDYIVSPKSDVKISGIQQITVPDLNLLSKLRIKYTAYTKFDPYFNELGKLLKKEKQLIVQIIDDYGFMVGLINYLEKNNLRNRVYFQYFYHGFSTYTTSERLLSKTDELILLSNSSYLSFKENCRSLPVRIRVFNNGIDTSLFYPVVEDVKNSLREKLNLPKEKLIFMWCSQDREKKGLEIILDSWLQLQKKYSDKIELIVLGSTKKIDSKNVKVIGRVDYNLLPQYYQSSDVFLFPTLCHEGFGLSLLEAMSCGLYCIASDNGAVKEVTNNGKLAKLIQYPNIVNEWTKAISETIDDYSKNVSNPYREDCLKDIFEISDWCKRYDMIISEAKQNFSNRLYI